MLRKLISLELKKIGRLKIIIVILVLTLPLAYTYLYVMKGDNEYIQLWKQENEFYSDVKGELTRKKYDAINSESSRLQTEIQDGETNEKKQMKMLYLQEAKEQCEDILQTEKNRQIIIKNAEKNVKDSAENDLYTIRYNKKIMEKAKNISPQKIIVKNMGYSELLENKDYIFYIAIAVVIAICGIFTGEKESGMESLLCTTQNGRKMSFRAKYIVMIILCTAITAYFQLLNLLGEIYAWRLNDFTFPLRCIYKNTLYDINYIETYILITLIRIILVIMLGNIVMLASAIAKKTVASVGISMGIIGIFIGIPYYVYSWSYTNMSGNYVVLKTLDIMKKYLATYATFTIDYFKEYKLVNVFGYPVADWKLILALCMICSLVMAFISCKLYCRSKLKRGIIR